MISKPCQHEYHSLDFREDVHTQNGIIVSCGNCGKMFKPRISTP
jgi:hypothetical protein